MSVLRARGLAAATLALAWLLVALPALAADKAQLEGRALGDALRAGGYVLYFRHATMR
jgi:hypothetical protein